MCQHISSTVEITFYNDVREGTMVGINFKMIS